MERRAYCWRLDRRRARHPRRNDRKVPAISRTADERDFRACMAVAIRRARSILRVGLDVTLDPPGRRR